MKLYRCLTYAHSMLISRELPELFSARSVLTLATGMINFPAARRRRVANRRDVLHEILGEAGFGYAIDRHGYINRHGVFIDARAVECVASPYGLSDLINSEITRQTQPKKKLRVVPEQKEDGDKARAAEKMLEHVWATEFLHATKRASDRLIEERERRVFSDAMGFDGPQFLGGLRPGPAYTSTATDRANTMPTADEILQNLRIIASPYVEPGKLYGISTGNLPFLIMGVGQPAPPNPSRLRRLVRWVFRRKTKPFLQDHPESWFV